MNSQEYKEKKLDKMMRDAVKMVNNLGSFGYGDVADALAKNALTTYLITMIRLNDVANVDFEIMAQSMLDDMEGLSNELVSKVKQYDKLIREESEG